MGLDRKGKPVDARGLFEAHLLSELITGIFLNYYKGFVDSEYTGALPNIRKGLVPRMIDEMGVDLHMEEILRVDDQKRMTDRELTAFLVRRGYEEVEASRFQRGVEDIRILSGPHLGGFNQGISLPEIIETVGTMSAMCIAGKYFRERTTGRG